MIRVDSFRPAEQDSQIHYIMQALREMLESNIATLECRQQLHDAYNVKVDAAHRNKVWPHGRQLVQERGRPGDRQLTVATGRLLGVHARVQPRPFRRRLCRRVRYNILLTRSNLDRAA
jgi:hypothetical protein